MCGIAGLLSTRPIQKIEELECDLKEALRHRGPDDQGVYLSKDQAVALIHTRLAIQDLSHLAAQPMVSPDRRFVIIFNGEIYNFKELRADLERSGESLVSQSDTEIILKLFSKKKEKCLQNLRGMFAFAIWDEVEKTCFLARDPFGIKPLYYLQQSDQCFFASEFKVLQKHAPGHSQVHCEALGMFLRKGSMPGSATADERINQLPPGHFMKWKDGKWEPPACYWKIDFPSASFIEEKSQAVSLTRRMLLESVQKHFVSDVDVGIFLSGGLDSTAILALSRELGFQRLKTYTVGFKNFPDECDLARRTAQYFKTEQHEIILDANAADQLMEEYLAATDLPTIDGLNVMAVSKFARDQGAKVVLSGLGGDELFGGYKTFSEVPRLYRFARNALTRNLLRAAAMGMTVFCSGSKWKRLSEMLSQKTISLRDVYLAYRGIFSPSEAKKILKELGFPVLSQSFYSAEKMNPDWEQVSQVGWLEWTIYLRDQLLRDADVFSMRFGLELRVPFVDSVLFDGMKEISPRIRLNHKCLLKTALPEIPDWIMNQPKRGFLFPFSSWNILDRHFKTAALRDRARKLPEWYQKWALLQLDHFMSRQQ